MKTRNWNWKYVLQALYGGEDLYHSWQLVGRFVAVELHISENSERAYGGIEFHHSSPKGDYANEKPSHQECWLTKRPCWHDGSSLWVSEYWIPHWEACRKNPLEVLKLLVMKMNDRFGYTETD